MTLYVKRIISTVQGGLDLELAPKTLLVGVNGAGKSRVRRSIELALVGTASDVALRDEVAKGLDLLQLATPGQDLRAQAFLSDGSEAVFMLRAKITGKGSRAKTSSSAVEPSRPRCVNPETVMPLFTLRENVLGKPETARRFFLGHTSRQIQRSDVLAKLPPMLHAKYEQAVSATGVQSMQPEIEKLLAAYEYAAKRAGEETRSVNASERIVEETAAGLPAPPSEAEEVEAKRNVEAAREALERAVAAYQQQQAAADLIQRVQLAEQSLEAAQKRYVQAQQQLAYIEQEASKLVSVEEARKYLMPMPKWQRAAIDAVLAFAEAETGGGLPMVNPDPPEVRVACVCCGGAVQPGTFARRAEAAKADLARHEQSQQQATEYVAGIEAQHRKKEELLAGARFDIQSAHSSVQLAEQALKALREAAQGITSIVPTLTIEAARHALIETERVVEMQKQAKAAWESTRKVRNNALAASNEAHAWKQLAEACNDVVRDLLDAGVQSFVNRVQAFLPPTDVFQLRLRDGAREVCQFGLLVGEHLRTALSGAESSRVTAALAAVCGPQSDDQLAIIMPHQLRERAYDPKTLTEVLLSFSRIPQQVILESPISPSEVPPGWLMIPVDGRLPAKPKPLPVEPVGGKAKEPATMPAVMGDHLT